MTVKKVTLYNATGGSMEVDDTPHRRSWARGKGYKFDKPPASAPVAEQPKPPKQGGESAGSK